MKVSQISQVQQTTLSNSSSIDKDMFLKLLVAQMKYQDPINVQSNSEYITQFATFHNLNK
jgi:flagellar basal-body rod modification protein FlgD